LKSAGEFDVAALRLLDDTQRLYKPDYEWRRVWNIDRRYSKKFFDRLFQQLQTEECDWQQAIFVRLLFEFEVPATVLLRARWNDFYPDFWVPWPPGEKKFRPWRRRRVDGEVNSILNELKARNSINFPDSPFLFPSAKSASGHMMSFKPFWRKIAVEMGVAPKRLWILTRTYQRVVLLPKVWMRAFADFRPSA
jgi:integrase